MSEQVRNRKKNPLSLWLGAALITFGLLAVFNGISSVTDNKTRLIAPEGIITIEKVESPEDRQQGLSNRKSISEGDGMLFVFDEVKAENCFWMKDMQFSIDMIWMNEAKEVITVKPNVSPDTYPDSFCPSSPAKYGLEVEEDRAASLGITEGAILRF